MTVPDLGPANYPAEPPPVDCDLVELRNLITSTADAYATEHDHVVVLDDVVAEEIARKVRDWFGGAR